MVVFEAGHIGGSISKEERRKGKREKDIGRQPRVSACIEDMPPRSSCFRWMRQRQVTTQCYTWSCAELYSAPPWTISKFVGSDYRKGGLLVMVELCIHLSVGASEEFLEDVGFQKNIKGNDAMNRDPLRVLWEWLA